MVNYVALHFCDVIFRSEGLSADLILCFFYSLFFLHVDSSDSLIDNAIR